MPDTLEGWNPAEDGLTATDQFGDNEDNSTAWAVKFDELDFEKMKIESGDKSYSREYTKSEVEGVACKDIEFLGNPERIKECGGASVSIYTNGEEVS